MVVYKYGMLKDLVTPMPYTVKKKNEQFECDNNIFSFDIETSSAWLTTENELLSYSEIKKRCDDKNKLIKKFVKKCTPCSLCYIWQFGINDKVVYGRELEDFALLLEELKTIVVNPTIWVHNLSYEYQFILNIAKLESVFARDSHKPIYAIFDGIKFRCSYFLTRLSLAKWAESTGKVKKKVGDLDYLILRTPKTKLTEKELGYCEYDILCMYYGLYAYRTKYGTIENIPLTQTGEVRRVVRDMYKNDVGYHRKMTDLVPDNEEDYLFLRQAFAGGYTHANYLFAKRTIKNVKSKDIASSYPFVMISEKFPSSKWFFIRPYEVEKYLNPDYSLLMDVTFYGIETTGFMTYISISKCIELTMLKSDKIDNGRLVSAMKVRMIITNVDYDIITKAYTIKKIKYNRVYGSVNKYLDVRYIRYTLDLFAKKTSLKGIDEEIYLQSKQFINSLYGMMVSDLVNDNFSFINDKWVNNRANIQEVLDELHSKPWKNFLAYQHGVWVTAYARHNLWEVILQMDNDVVYVDTDSVKYVGNHEDIFNTYNKSAMEKLKVSLAKHHIPFEMSNPYSETEKRHFQIGIYETEKPYLEFRTLGAKRYAYKQWVTDKKTKEKHLHLGITVSGVNKEKGAKALDSLEQFDDDFVFDDEHTGKLIFTYLSNMDTVIWNKGQEDEYISHYRYGINSLPTTYCMSMKDEYIDLIEIAIQHYL